MELFILIGSCYAIYRVGIAIATNIDYYSTEKEQNLSREENTDSMTVRLLAHYRLSTIIST